MADTSTPTQSHQQQQQQQQQNAESITLANVHQYLDGDGIFLPEDQDDEGPTPHEIDAAIHNASNSLLNDSSNIDPTLHNSYQADDGAQGEHDESMIDPSLMDQQDHLETQSPQFSNSGRNVRTADNTTLHRQA
jgi:hypothetical protein